MDTREEEDLTIQIPPQDGSQTERTRGTFGGRQRWISGGDKHGTNTSHGTSSLLSPRGGKSAKVKVTAPSVQSFLNSMGIVVGEETHIVEKEVNEVSTLRRDYDNIRNANWRKEMEIKKLEEEINNMSITLNARVSDGSQAKAKATNIENKSTLYESKLEEEIADRGVYNHMIQRLTAEALAAKKLTLEREKQLLALQNELASNMATLLAARQEKTAAEATYKRLYEQWWEKRQENIRALDDMQQAVEQTKLKYEILEQREISRKKYVQEAIGEMKMKESKRLRHESNAQIAHFSEIQEELSDTDWKLMNVESELKKIVEAAGTNDVDKIIAKYVNREETFRALKEEHTVADARMRKLREKHKQLNETLSNLRGSAVNTRTIYQEMDQTSERLKDIEKEAAALSEKFNRQNVMMDAFRACMLKCLTKLSTVHGSLDYDDHHELSRAMETPTAELLHMVEQKLNRVLDVINREKAERELHRTEGSLGGTNVPGTAGGTGGNGAHSPDPNDKNAFVRQPAPSESEEHFILRMSSANTTPGNIRVRPKARIHDVTREMNFMTLTGESKTASPRRPQPVIYTENDGSDGDDDNDVEPTTTNAVDEETVIDRTMRKKLVGLIVNRGRRGKKSVSNSQQASSS